MMCSFRVGRDARSDASRIAAGGAQLGGQSGRLASQRSASTSSSRRARARPTPSSACQTAAPQSARRPGWAAVGTRGAGAAWPNFRVLVELFMTVPFGIAGGESTSHASRLGLTLYDPHQSCESLTCAQRDVCKYPPSHELPHARPQSAARFRRRDGRRQHHACRRPAGDDAACRQQCAQAAEGIARRRTAHAHAQRREADRLRRGAVAAGARVPGPPAAGVGADPARPAGGSARLSARDGRRGGRLAHAATDGALPGQRRARADRGAPARQPRPARPARSRRRGLRSGPAPSATRASPSTPRRSASAPARATSC